MAGEGGDAAVPRLRRGTPPPRVAAAVAHQIGRARQTPEEEEEDPETAAPPGTRPSPRQEPSAVGGAGRTLLRYVSHQP